MTRWATALLLCEMNEAPTDRGMRGRLFASVVGILLFVYVASVGPAAAYYIGSTRRDAGGGMSRMILGYLTPMRCVCDTCPPVASVVDHYVRWCLKTMYGYDARELTEPPSL